MLLLLRPQLITPVRIRIRVSAPQYPQVALGGLSEVIPRLGAVAAKPFLPPIAQAPAPPPASLAGGANKRGPRRHAPPARHRPQEPWVVAAPSRQLRETFVRACPQLGGGAGSKRDMRAIGVPGRSASNINTRALPSKTASHLRVGGGTDVDSADDARSSVERLLQSPALTYLSSRGALAGSALVRT